MLCRPGEIPDAQSVIVSRNTRALRLRRGWTQAKLGELMGWPTPSTVCAAEGRRSDRQRRFTIDELERLAAIFGTSPERLTTRCANCDSQPRPGFACLLCGAYSPLNRPLRKRLRGNRQALPAPIRGEIKLPARAGGLADHGPVTGRGIPSSRMRLVTQGHPGHSPPARDPGCPPSKIKRIGMSQPKWHADVAEEIRNRVKGGKYKTGDSCGLE